ncbi:uncharacterized protein LOC135487917 isoform X3 [Lineus longissimus]|uniref:uncharacterized protein LOC135487917 isoform X3 n=1 Tax=Lineus longissimus TaxID=88925 RepID=UPI00315C7A5A
MMKDGIMSVAETEEEFSPIQESSPSEGQDERCSFENMQTELHCKGALLTKAWSDLFCFITKYQAELVMKENSVEIAEKEIKERKKQLEEMKTVAGDDENLHDVICAKERLLRKAQSELSVKDRMLQRVQSDLSSNTELLEKSECDLLKRQNELVRYRGNVEQLKSELKIKQEQILIKDTLLKKLQNQLMKENAELKEQLELERRALQLEKQSHDLTKRTMLSPGQKRARTTAPSGVIEIPDSPPTLDLPDDHDFGLSNIVSMAESQAESSKRDRRISSRLPSSVTSASQSYSDHSSRLPHMPPADASSQISPAMPQRVTQFPKTFIGSTSDNGTVSETIAMTTSDTFFPLSVSEDTKSGIDILGGMKIDADIQGGVPQSATPSSGTSDNEGPMSVPGPIASPGMSPDGGADGKTDCIGLDLQCDEEEPIGRVGPACPPKEKADNFVCKICGNSYKRRDNLRRHQRIHFGLMKTCDLCHKQFADSCDLRRHLENTSAPNVHGVSTPALPLNSTWTGTMESSPTYVRPAENSLHLRRIGIVIMLAVQI